MSEVTKLYENAGIEQTQDITCGDCEFVNYPEENKPCNACTQYGIKHHPPFTAEKQIELIKWLARQNFVVCKNLGGWHTGINPTYDEDFGITCSKRATNLGSFEYALAGLINNLWQDLTEEEKQQVKGILE